MKGAYYQYLRSKGIPATRTTDAVEKAQAFRKEEAELRLARIMNGAEPEYQNGHPKDSEKGRSKPPII
jgi:hypothetical protein